MWTTNFCKSIYKNILLHMSSRLSKIRSVHTYVMPRTDYFGWICKLLKNSLLVIGLEKILMINDFRLFNCQKVWISKKIFSGLLGVETKGHCPCSNVMPFPSCERVPLLRLLLCHRVSRCPQRGRRRGKKGGGKRGGGRFVPRKALCPLLPLHYGEGRGGSSAVLALSDSSAWRPNQYGHSGTEGK